MGVRKKLVEASKHKVAKLEKRLADILQPVRPRREFVRGLRERIQVVNPPVIVRRLTRSELFLLVTSGLVSVAVLLVLGARALLSLLTALGVIQQADQQLKNQRRVTSQRV